MGQSDRKTDFDVCWSKIKLVRSYANAQGLLPFYLFFTYSVFHFS